MVVSNNRAECFALEQNVEILNDNDVTVDVYDSFEGKSENPKFGESSPKSGLVVRVKFVRIPARQQLQEKSNYQTHSISSTLNNCQPACEITKLAESEIVWGTKHTLG